MDLHLGRRAERIDVQDKQITDDRGDTYTFDKLLLATGGRPHRLPFGGDLIIYYRTLEDYRRLYGTAQQRRRFAVIGGGFIGSEIAAALAMNEKEVTMIFPGLGIGAYLFPPELCKFLNDFYRQKGVGVLTGEFVTGFERRGEEFVLHTSSGRQIVVDGVVAGLGIEPNVELAEQAGLTLENGIFVDELAQTSHPDIYAAGDVAMFYSPELGRNRRVEHEDNANVMGRIAGRNMAGATSRTTTCPSSTPTCSSWATRPSATWTRGWKPWPTGKSPSAKGSSTTCSTAGCGACCCGTSGSRSTPPAT